MLRTIVPIYQSEISPPNHVFAHMLVETCSMADVLFPLERRLGVHGIYGQHYRVRVFGGACHTTLLVFI
jgi:hypothetical protein